MKKFVGIAMAALMALSMAGCGSKETKSTDTNSTKAADTGSDQVTLAFVGPQTGDFAEYGKSMKTAAQIAIDEWNENGGVLGKQIKLVDYDDGNTSEQAASIAQNIVGDESISAVIGHFSSGVAMTAAEVYQEEGLPLVNASAAHVDYSKIGDCIFRNNAIYVTEASTCIQVTEYLGCKKLGILNPNSDAGVSVTNEIETLIDKYGDKFHAELVLAEYYEDGTVDFSATISKFRDAGVDVVYSSGAYAQMGPFIKQYREKDADVKFIMSAGCFSAEFLSLTGEAAEGVYMGTSFFYESADEKVQEFSKKFKEVYGADPSTFAAQSYDAAYAILYAIEAGNSADRADVAANLPKTDFQGVTGKITFDEDGNVPKEQTLLIVENGAYKEVPGALLSQTDYEAKIGLK